MTRFGLMNSQIRKASTTITTIHHGQKRQKHQWVFLKNVSQKFVLIDLTMSQLHLPVHLLRQCEPIRNRFDNGIFVEQHAPDRTPFDKKFEMREAHCPPMKTSKRENPTHCNPQKAN